MLKMKISGKNKKRRIKKKIIKKSNLRVGGQKRENPHFSASRALIKNRLGESSNLDHRGIHAKFQVIWSGSLVRAMGRVENGLLIL